MSERKRPGFMLYNHSARILANLSATEAGEIIKAVCSFELEGIEPRFSSETLQAIFQGIKADLENDAERYKAKCEQNARNARMRGQANDSQC